MPRTYFRGPGQRSPQTEDSTWRVPVPGFYDPYFFINGSEPEKMVMKELVRRGIYFEHVPQTNDIKWGNLKQAATSDPSKWEADFLFPQFKIWLEVQGFYFHTLPGVPYRDMYRLTIIQAAGWRPIYWFDYDIIARLPELMDSVPEFYRPPSGKGGWAPRSEGQTDGDSVGQHDVWHGAHRGTQSYYGSHHNRVRTFAGPTTKARRKARRTYGNLPFFEGGTGIDHLAGLRTANANRASTPQFESKYRRGRIAKITRKYRHRAY